MDNPVNCTGFRNFLQAGILYVQCVCGLSQFVNARKIPYLQIPLINVTGTLKYTIEKSNK